MSLLAASGRRKEALRIYQTLATALEEELDVTPSVEVMAIRAELLAEESSPLAAGVPVAPRAARLTNLPLTLSSFVGRAWDVSEITHMLEPGQHADWLGECCVPSR